MAMHGVEIPFQNLSDFETLYGDLPPHNFAWFLCRLHVAAKQLYEAGGPETLARLFRAIVKSTSSPADEPLATALRTDVQPLLGEFLVGWPDAIVSQMETRQE
jgi:hypothetical protein